MDAISNADRFVALLRQKLTERSEIKANRLSRAQARQSTSSGVHAVRRVTGQSARAGQDDQQLRRTLVEQVLAERFGPRFINEPHFQDVVTKVTDLMSADSNLAGLLNEVIAVARR